MNNDKDAAFEFLKGLEQALSKELASSTEMRLNVRNVMAAAKDNPKERHLKTPEAAFLNKYVLPILFAQLQQEDGLSVQEARNVLLNEYHRCMPELSTRSPIRWKRHPFHKALGASATSIYEQWANHKSTHSLTQSCPDFALNAPFPHRIVFEGKYFQSGSRVYAERELVKGIYQAFFYRGLSKLPPSARGHAAWDYDYACLLAYDASPLGSLKTAWEKLDAEVKDSFWDGGGIYVMILR